MLYKYFIIGVETAQYDLNQGMGQTNLDHLQWLGVWDVQLVIYFTGGFIGLFAPPPRTPLKWGRNNWEMGERLQRWNN